MLTACHVDSFPIGTHVPPETGPTLRQRAPRAFGASPLLPSIAGPTKAPDPSCSRSSKSFAAGGDKGFLEGARLAARLAAQQGHAQLGAEPALAHAVYLALTTGLPVLTADRETVIALDLSVGFRSLP